MGQDKGYRDRARAYFSSKTACHIITHNDNWINGFIVEEPEEFFFKVLDKVDGVVVVHYVDITKFEDYIGKISSLPEVEE